MNKKAFNTRDISSDWFHKHFVPVTCAHWKEAGRNDKRTTLLFFDHCSAHPPAEILIKNHVHATYTPSNVNLLIRPCDEGILTSMQSEYKHAFLNNMLAAWTLVWLWKIFKRSLAQIMPHMLLPTPRTLWLKTQWCMPDTAANLWLCSVIMINKMLTLKDFTCRVRKKMFDLLTYAKAVIFRIHQYAGRSGC